MSQEQRIRIGWCQRPEPLTPLAALVPRQGAAVLLARELTEDMRGLSVGDTLVLFAKSEHLPWCREIRYFGRDALAPTLLLPTHSVPTIPLELFERCIRKRYSYSGPILIDPKANRVVGLTAERPLSRSVLQQFIEGGAA